jgi:hypothetical protein
MGLDRWPEIVQKKIIPSLALKGFCHGDLSFVQNGRFEIRSRNSHFFSSLNLRRDIFFRHCLPETSRDAPALGRNRDSNTSIFKPSDFHDAHIS